MKGTLKKLTAWLLSIAMVMPLFTGVLPAFAEGEGDSAPETPPAVTDNRDFANSDVTRRPRLYVDFLGDNYTYNPLGVKNPGGLSAPGTENQSKKTNDNGTNTWEGYTPTDVNDSKANSNGTIFWVGVGIDRMNELDLFRQDDSGIYSLELGFYYDNKFIEPYTGLSDSGHTEEEIRASYKEVIEKANLGDYDTYNWNKEHQYKIVAAETGLMPQSDRVTQESISDPMMYSDGSGEEAIMTEGNSWRMTYVSLEREEGATSNRFADWYDPGEENDKDTQYLLIIPFRLKEFDNNFAQRVCLRLTRSAGLFSIGGKDGDTPYAAWERVTTRNFNRELKLMTNFMGDLNIFDGQRQKDQLYKATLDTKNGGGTGNTVDLYVTDDPSPNKVHARLNGEAVENLASGVGMSVDVFCQSGYEVTVRIYYEVPDPDSSDGSMKKVDIPYTQTTVDANKSNYTYIMPNHDVIVDVKFNLKENTEFILYLNEDHSKEKPADPANTEIPKPNNRTELTATRTTDVVTVNEDSDRNNYLNLPGEKVTVTGDSPPDTVLTVLEVNVALHNDYCAEVAIYNENTQSYILPDARPDDASVGTGTGTPPYALGDGETYNVVTMLTSGTLTLNRMPQSDLVVKVTYKPAEKHRATLEVWHKGTTVKTTNVAQLETTVYTDANEPMKAYSGVVYDDDTVDPEDHSAVKDGFRVLEKVDVSAARHSGSLGGDGDDPMAWGDAASAPDSFMTLLYEAYHSTATPTLADFADEVKAGLSAYDLRKLDIAGDGSNLGLRKNAVGEFYTDADVANTASDLYVRLFDLAGMMAAVPANYVKEVKDGGGNLLYTHFVLTPAQVQAYLLDCGVDPDAAVIKDNITAETAVRAHTWYNAADTHYPPTDGQPEDANGKKACYLEARPGRQMAVILEADSADTVLDSVKLKDPAGKEATVSLQKDPNYQNVYLFDMPGYDCIVEVTYTERETHKLDIEVSGTDSDLDNIVKVRAYTPDPGSTTAKAELWENLTGGIPGVPGDRTGSIDKVLEGSTVTATIQWKEGYSVSVTLQKGSSIEGTWSSSGENINLINGKPFTFPMPKEDAKLTIKYTHDVPTYTATLITRDYGDDVSGSGSMALWKTKPPDANWPGLYGGEHLEGEVTVTPGYYIYSVEGFTEDGAYPVVIDGNGWNNGAGGAVNLDTVMPPADYKVRVTFRKGPPPEEPGKALTLRVKDPDNTGSGDPAVYDNNWAQAEVTRTDGGAIMTVARLGKVGRTFGDTTDTTWDVSAGDLVKLWFQPAEGYYVESVEVQPASLGGAVQWTAPVMTDPAHPIYTAELVMPAGSAEVVVTFAKGDKDPRQFVLVVDKTERGDGAPEENNYIRDVDSPTLYGAISSAYTVGQVSLPCRVPKNTGSAGGDTGVALPGETVTIGINVEAGWYIHSITTTDNWGRLPYTLSDNGWNNGSGGTVTASFVMPPSDVSAVVNYRKGPPPEKETDHILEVIVADPDNTGSGDPAVYDNNWAQASAPSLGSAIIGPVGLATGRMLASDYVQMGDLVTIEYEYEANSGYTLDIIVVTPTGLHITPAYLGSAYDVGTGKTTGQAQFTMPDENITVLVRFKKGIANRYTANLILRMPDGVASSDYDQVGRGSFAGVLGNDPTGGIYSRIANVGETIDFAALARNGYYIDRITITPATLGVPYTFSGSFAWQEGIFVMPAADVQVNVWFAKLWPDEVEYNLTLKVYDLTGGDSTASFNTIAGTALTAPDNYPVGHGESKTLTNKAHDLDRVMVKLDPDTDRYVKKVTVTDSRSQVRELPWDYVPGGIAFDMTPAHVTVTVWYAMRTETEHEERSKVTLHISGNTGADGVSLAGTAYPGAAFTLTDSGSQTNVPAGSALTLTATPESGHSVVAAYAVSSSGGQLLVPMTLVTSGGTVDFAMPAEDADVYVVFLDTQPEQEESPATLVVAGPSGSGSAKLSATVGSATRTTGTVNAAGAGSIFAPPGTVLTVDLTVNPNYSIASIRVVNAQGENVPYTWNGDQRQFTLAMPTTDGGVRIYVELEEVDPNKHDLIAQVVVNDGGDTDNTAKLRRNGDPDTNRADRLTGLTVGDGISLDLMVKSGYKIDYIKVVPAKYGIQPSLRDSISSQTTGFTMPGEDVVVYVKFSKDDRERKTVTLKTTGEYDLGNKATIHSAYSGTQIPVRPPEGVATVQAAPATATMPAEWVTVYYDWAEGYVPTVTVIEDGSGTPVPFTQDINNTTNRKGQISFPMVDNGVTVTVHYAKEPVTYPAVIHVIDLDNPAVNGESWGKLTWTTETTNAVMALPAPGGTATIQVPAGEEVTVDISAQDADTENKTYIQAAYVIYRAGGQMINFDLTPDDPNDPTSGFSGNKTDKFIMHPGQNDVYVYFTKVKPETTDYAAVLMLDSNASDTTSTATITNTNATDTQVGSATVVANGSHGYVTATDGNTITVTVDPAAGYTIDSILMTPLGISTDQGGTVALIRKPDGSYEFKMPAKNVAVRVKLKVSSSGEYKAMLHYRMQDGTPTDPTKDWAMLSYESGGVTYSCNQDEDILLVDEDITVTVGVSVTKPNLVLSAYVLQSDGTLVPLSPKLEGTEEDASLNDNTLIDATATFVMPAANVDVYIWFTNTPPATKWYTAVLTVTDDDGAGKVNSGLNSAQIWVEKDGTKDTGRAQQVYSNGIKLDPGTGSVAKHAYMWVTEGEKVFVKTDPPYDGYVFQEPATISHSDSKFTFGFDGEDRTKAPGEYTYFYTVQKVNTAVVAHFVNSTITQNDLRVEIVDRDNPGNGTVTNSVRVSPDLMTALTVNSTTSAGAWQRIPGVTAGTKVDFKVNPENSDYAFVVQLIDPATGNVTQTWYNDADNFNMPNQKTTLRVTFYKAWNVTLSVKHIGVAMPESSDCVAQLVEDAFGTTITATEGTPNTITVPNATNLAASMQSLNSNDRVVSVLLKRSGRVDQPLSADGLGVYHHTLSRSDVEIQFILAPRTETDPTYIASVSAKNKPAAVVDPVIRVTSASRTEDTPNLSWTEAKANDTVEVTLDVPYGYKAELTATNGAALSEATVDATDVAAGITGKTVTFTMPTANVHVTVKYIKTRFTATIVVTGNGNGTAEWLAPYSGQIVTDLKEGDTLNFTATPGTGSKISSIIGSGSVGYISGSTNSTVNHTIPMPPEDIVVTVVFTKEKTQSYHLDLHVTGTAGGMATLSAPPGMLQSTPVVPNGFSRLEGVESGDGVTLTAKPEDGYTVSVSYYLYSGGILTAVDNITPNPSVGGTYTFDMPATNTCIYVTFRKGENPPPANPEDPNDPNRYLDLHVSGTGGGTATLDAGAVGILQSTPTNPNSVSTLRPIVPGTHVTLTVTPKPGYTASVSYYVYNGGTPIPTDLTTIPANGGTVTFIMPNQSTCVYVTFRAQKDSMHYLDLHVTNPAGGTATLAADGFGALTSTPTNPQTYGQINKVETGTPVMLDVTDVGVDYTVTVSYYLHDGSTLYYTTFAVDRNSGGRATFDMPNTNTCIYVRFNGPGDDPDPDPNARYLDLHVSNPAGGSATLTARDAADTSNVLGSVSSTPAAPVSGLQRIQPSPNGVPAGSPVTLDVTVQPDYTVSVSYYVYNGATLGSFTSTVTSTTGGTVTFDMPAYSTCVYVTYKPLEDPDPSRHYLDLHVSNPAGGSASLDAGIFGRVESTPAAPVSGLQRIEPVDTGAPVTLVVSDLQPGYTVTVSYSIAGGSALTYTTYSITSTDGGTATFDMPARSTCIYVSFQKPGDSPPDSPDPPDPPPPDPNEYIAFVVTTGTDGLPGNAAQDIVNRTDPTKTGGSIWRYGETGDNMFVTFTTEPGYTAVVTATRVDTGAEVTVIQQGTTLVGTASLNMPGGTDVRVLIEYKTVQPPATHNLSLRLIGHDYVTGNMGELSGGVATIARNGQDGIVSTTANTGDYLYLDAGWAVKYRIRRITVTTGGVTTDLNWNEYLQTATSDFFMPDGDTVVTVYFNSSYKATLFVIDADGNDFLSNSAADTYDPSAAGIVPQTKLEVTRLSDPVRDTTKTHTPIEELYGDERVTTTVDPGTMPDGTKISSVIATTGSGTVNLTETATGSGVYHYDMSTATRDPDNVDVTVILGKEDEDLYIATVYKVDHDNMPGNTAAITNATTSGLPDGTIWTAAHPADGLTVSVTTEPDYYAIVTAVIAGTNTPVPVLQWAVQGTFDATLTMPGANVDITVTYTKDPPKSDLKLTLSGHDEKAGNIGTVSDVAGAEPTLPLTANGGMAPDTSDYSVTKADVTTGIQLEVWGQSDTGYMVEKMELKVSGITVSFTMDAQNKAYTPLPYGDVEIIIYYKEGKRTPRPFDPEHPHVVDNGDGTTTVVDDYEHGRIIGENNNNNTATVVVPLLYGTEGKDKNPDGSKQYNPYFEAEQVTFKLYLRDDTTGTYTELTPGADYTMTAPSGSGAYDVVTPPQKYESPNDGVEYEYVNAQFILGEVAGGKLADQIKDGLTLYITATYDNAVVSEGPWRESLHTQLIIPPADQSPRPYDPVHSHRYNAPGVWSGGDYPTLGDDSPNPDWSESNSSVSREGWILAGNQDEKVTVLIPTLYFGSDMPADPPVDDDDYVTDAAEALTDAGASTPVADEETPELPPIYNFYWREVDADTGAETYHPLVDGVDIDIEISSMKSLPYVDNPKGDFPKAADPDPQIHHYGYELTFTAHVVDPDDPNDKPSDSPIADYIESGGIIYVTATRQGGTVGSTPTWTELESEMTQVVIRNDDIPKPSDPEDLNSEDYEDRWITSQNWVDYLIVTVPTLDTDGKHPISVDPNEVTFRFYLTEGAERDPGNEIEVTDLLVMINPNIFFSEDKVLDASGDPFDKPQMVWDTNGYAYPGKYMEAAKSWSSTDPASDYRYVAEYESGNYYSGPDKDGVDTDFIGARFVLQLSKDADETDSRVPMLQDIWTDIGGNYGTMDEDHPYRLYISAQYTTWDDSGNVVKEKESGKTDFEVKPYYTLSGILESYAPSHIATFSLYDQELVDTKGINVDQSDLSDLTAETPFLVYKQFKEWGFGSGLWQLEYAIRTSELMGTYTMLIEKAGHVSFTWSGMQLSEDTLDPADPRKLTFTVAGQEKDASGNELVAVDEDGRELPGVIALFGGDINGDRYVRIEDYTVLSAFFGGRRKQTRVNDPTDTTKWNNSTYNPESVAYWADIDGSLYVNTGDHAIWNTKRNYNKNYTDYAATWELRGAVATTMEVALLMEELEGLPPEELPPEEKLPDGEDLPPEGEEPAKEPEPPLEEPPAPDEGDNKSTEDKNLDTGDQTAENREPNEGEQPSEPETDKDQQEGAEPPESRLDPAEEDESPKAPKEDDDQVDENKDDLETGGMEPPDLEANS